MHVHADGRPSALRPQNRRNGIYDGFRGALRRMGCAQRRAGDFRPHTIDGIEAPIMVHDFVDSALCGGVLHPAILNGYRAGMAAENHQNVIIFGDGTTSG